MRLPETLVRTTVLREGPAGERWLATVPRLVSDLLERWHCTRDGALRHGGVALVVPVIAPDGPAVIKVSFPHEQNCGEAAALRLLGGRATVGLYADDPDRWALLTERADRPGPAARLPAEESVELLGALAARLAVPDDGTLTPVADTVPGWHDQVAAQIAAAPGAVAEQILARAHQGREAVASDSTRTLLHGDLHEANVLGSDREPWLTIDHKGWSGSAAYDAWTVALTRHHELRDVADPARVVDDRIRRFALAAGVDADFAAEIAHARAVSSLLYEAATPNRTFGRDLLERYLTRRR